MTDYEERIRTHRLIFVAIPLAVIAAAAGLAALTSNDDLDTVLGAVAGALSVIVLAIVAFLVWRARNPVVSKPVTAEPVDDRRGAGASGTGTTDADQAALDALEPLRAARDER